jgi:uncharacterized protein (DUF2062 family)
MSGPPEKTGDTTRRRRRRSLKRRSLKLLLDLMGREQPPERVAAAVALGVGVGLSPFIGFHFILAVVLAFAFRLNKLDTVLGSLVGNPWTLPPFFAAGYRVGRALLGLLGFSSTRAAPSLHWHRILHQDFWVAFRGPGFGPRLAAFLVGTTLLATAVALATYGVLRGLLRLYHRRHPRVAARAARRRAISERPPEEAQPLPPDHRVH